MSEKEAGWWDWVQSTKDKVVNQSAEVFEFVKKDIEEFSKVVTEEASSVVSSTATSLKEKLQLDDQSSSASQVKKSVSGFLNHVAEVFTPSPDDEDQEAIMIWNQQPVTLDRLQASIYAFCSTPSNFLKEPENEQDYETWLQSFTIKSHEDELPELLLQNAPLGSSYSSLVPSQMSHTEFWHRYFYEVERLKKAEEKREEMKRRVQASDEEAHIVWEDDEDSSEKVDIPEQVQQQLLEDYEKEMKEQSVATKKIKNSEEAVSTSTSTTTVNTHKTAEEAEENLEQMQRDSKSSTPSSKDTEEEWEKVEPESSSSPLPRVINKEDSESSQNEDWENWE